jgi:hypothetical protein
MLSHLTQNKFQKRKEKYKGKERDNSPTRLAHCGYFHDLGYEFYS